MINEPAAVSRVGMRRARSETRHDVQDQGVGEVRVKRERQSQQEDCGSPFIQPDA